MLMTMRRILIAVLAAGAVLGATPSSAQALTARTYDEYTDTVFTEEVVMPRADIRYYVKESMAENFEGFTVADRPRMRCRRTSRISGRCSIAWFLGDSIWSGRVRVWLTVERGTTVDEVHWNYAYTIRYLDDYCFQVRRRPLRRCSRIFRVR